MGNIMCISEKTYIQTITDRIIIIVVPILTNLIFNVNNGEVSIIIGKVKESNIAIIHPFSKLKDIKDELRQPINIPTNNPYLHPCNSGLERSSNPIIGNKLKIKAKSSIGNNSNNNS